jgi:hypothetical protein
MGRTIVGNGRGACPSLWNGKPLHESNALFVHGRWRPRAATTCGTQRRPATAAGLRTRRTAGRVLRRALELLEKMAAARFAGESEALHSMVLYGRARRVSLSRRGMRGGGSRTCLFSPGTDGNSAGMITEGKKGRELEGESRPPRIPESAPDLPTPFPQATWFRPGARAAADQHHRRLAVRQAQVLAVIRSSFEKPPSCTIAAAHKDTASATTTAWRISDWSVPPLVLAPAGVLAGHATPVPGRIVRPMRPAIRGHLTDWELTSI